MTHLPYASPTIQDPSVVICPTCGERIQLTLRKDFESYDSGPYAEHHAAKHSPPKADPFIHALGARIGTQHLVFTNKDRTVRHSIALPSRRKIVRADGTQARDEAAERLRFMHYPNSKLWSCVLFEGAACLGHGSGPNSETAYQSCLKALETLMEARRASLSHLRGGPSC